MVRYLLIIISAILFFSCQKKVTLTEEQKKADAVYLSLKEEFTLDSKGSQMYLNSSRMQLQSHAAFNRLYADSHLNYDPAYQKMTILKAETENSMGKSIVKENAINDMLPKEAQRSAYYNRLRTKVVSHMGTEIGAIINFDYSIESNADYKPGLFENIVIGKNIPVKEYKIIISIPKGKKIKYQLFNSEIKPTIEELENEEKYTWVFNDISAIIHEKGEPKFRNDLIRLVFSTISEEECGKFVKKSGKFNYLDSALVNISQKIIKGSQSDVQKVFKLHDEVNKNIALNNLSYKQSSYRGRSSLQLWNEVNASAFEKAKLLNDLLNVSKIKSNIIVAIPNELEKFAKNNPDVWQDFYVYLDSLDSGTLLKITEENYSSRHYELGEYKFYKPYSGEIFNPEKNNNIIVAKVDINLNSRKKLWGNAEIQLSGLCFHNLKKSDRKYVKDLLQYSLKYNETEIGKYNYSIEYSAKDIDDSYFYISLPEYKTGSFSYKFPIFSEDRNSPLKIKAPLDERYSYSLSYNKRFRMVNKPVDLVKENKLGKVIVKISDKSNKVDIERRLVISKSLISKEDYPYFKELLDLWTSPNYKKLYFTRTN